MEKNRKIKKSRSALLAATLLLATGLITTGLFTGCTAGGGTQSGSADTENRQDELQNLVEALYKDADAPAYETIELSKDDFENYAFTEYKDNYSAVAADALVNITPHSMVVIHTDNADGKELAEKIVLNADPNKWLCVGAERVSVNYTDHYVVLVMSDAETTGKIEKNFSAMAIELDGMEANRLTTGNSRFEEVSSR